MNTLKKMKDWITGKLEKFNFRMSHFYNSSNLSRDNFVPKRIMKLRQLKHKSIMIAFSLAIYTNTFSQTIHNSTNDTTKNNADNSVSVRYIVNDVKKSVDFYTKYLGFTAEIQPASGGFAQ